MVEASSAGSCCPCTPPRCRTRHTCRHFQKPSFRQKTTWDPIGLQEKKGQARQKDVSTCVLALAMLSSFCRLPELARQQEQLKKVPLLLKAGPAPVLQIRLRCPLCMCSPLSTATPASYVERDGAHATHVPMLFLPRMLDTSDGHTAQIVRIMLRRFPPASVCSTGTHS